jgi:NAD(P)-dependent dehydrogenase (short-subunit alcohol dehydrogenase family)
MPPAEKVAELAPRLPMGRAGRPEEIAEAICWLLSEKASYTSAANLRVGGGRP